MWAYKDRFTTFWVAQIPEQKFNPCQSSRIKLQNMKKRIMMTKPLVIGYLEREKEVNLYKGNEVRSKNSMTSGA